MRTDFDDAVLKKLGNPAGVEVFSMEILDCGGVLFKAGVFKTVTRGPAKGRKRFNEKECLTACLSKAEVARIRGKVES